MSAEPWPASGDAPVRSMPPLPGRPACRHQRKEGHVPTSSHPSPTAGDVRPRCPAVRTDLGEDCMTGPGRSGGRAVLETLRAWGVRRVFTCPGSTEAAFLDATLDHPDFEVILTPHESIAVSAADGYARVTGEPAV